jgi:hypothetical protein
MTLCSAGRKTAKNFADNSWDSSVSSFYVNQSCVSSITLSKMAARPPLEVRSSHHAMDLSDKSV